MAKKTVAKKTSGSVRKAAKATGRQRTDTQKLEAAKRRNKKLAARIDNFVASRARTNDVIDSLRKLVDERTELSREKERKNIAVRRDMFQMKLAVVDFKKNIAELEAKVKGLQREKTEAQRVAREQRRLILDLHKVAIAAEKG